MPAIKSAARVHESRLKKRATEEKLETAGMMRWLLTYADMITLLLALFIILFSISTINKVKLQRLVHEISGGFNSTDAINNPPQGAAGDKTQNAGEMKEVQQILEAYIANKGLQKQVTVRQTTEGIVVSLLTDKALYDSGSAALRPVTQSLLTEIGTMLHRQNPEIRVEGYTDNVPIATNQYPTNWELSAARAAGVTRYLIENQHIDPAKVSLAGYGEYRPKHQNDTPEGRQLNRRVDIVILNASAPAAATPTKPSAAAPAAAKEPAAGKASTPAKGH